MRKGRIGYAYVLDLKSHRMMTNERDIVLAVIVKLDNSKYISDETH